MSSPPVPDPYNALGLPKDATSTQIKATYRKLALKWHPDKVADVSLKASASDQFHRIQQAYEILSDEDRRGRYDAQIRLAELRRDAMGRHSSTPKVDVRTGFYDMPTARYDTPTERYDMPTASPGRASYSARRSETVYEERRPSKAFDADYDDYFGDTTTRASSRKHADYERESKTRPPRDEREKGKDYTPRESRDSEKVRRDERRRTSERDRRKDRVDKRVPYVEEDSDEMPRYSRKMESDDVYYRSRERAMDPTDSDRSRSAYPQQYDDAREYIDRARGKRNPESRPSPLRTNSARDAYPAERPPATRRSSARMSTKEDAPRCPSAREHRKYSIPEDAESVETRERRPPTLQSHSSSPAAIKVPRDRSPTPRSATLPPRYDLRDRGPPTMRRAETMPSSDFFSKPSSRRRESTTPLKPSGLRKAEGNGFYPSPSPSPEYTTNPYSSKYPLADDDSDYGVPSSRRTVVVEPVDLMRERERRPTLGRETRSSSGRHTTLPPLRTTSYSYSPNEGGVTESPKSYTRSSPVSRRGSEQYLYTDMPSPSASKRYDYPELSREKERPRYSPSLVDASYVQEISPKDFKMQSGYSTRREGYSSRPHYNTRSKTSNN